MRFLRSGGLTPFASVLLLAALAFRLLTATVAMADDEAGWVGTNGGPDVPVRGLIYYGKRGFSGARAEIHENTNRTYVGESWDDQISSLACHLYLSATGFED